MTGDEVFAIRKKLGITQTALAQRLGVSFPTVNRWENGHHPVKQRHVVALLALDGIEAKEERETVVTLRRILGELSGLLQRLERAEEAGSNPSPTEAVEPKAPRSTGGK